MHFQGFGHRIHRVFHREIAGCFTAKDSPEPVDGTNDVILLPVLFSLSREILREQTEFARISCDTAGRAVGRPGRAFRRRRLRLRKLWEVLCRERLKSAASIRPN